MRCERCNQVINESEAREHLGQTLCEDCYLDALSPVRTCDPWAVHSAKTYEKHSGGSGELTPIQSRILSILKETGGIEPAALHALLGAELTESDLQRELAALRHMEKARAQKNSRGIIWRPW